tara:strand:+ start:163 stop:528 length:366 start_codon:yes stop_codon:yes gene_type:complete
MKILPFLALGMLLFSNIDHSKVRYGDVATFDEEKNDKVGTIESKQVYYKMPAYQKVRTGEYRKGTAKYTNAMRESTMEYRRVLKVTAKEKNLKLIVEAGGISDYPTTDITPAVISNLNFNF